MLIIEHTGLTKIIPGKKRGCCFCFSGAFQQSILDQFWNLFKTLNTGKKKTGKMEMDITVSLIWGFIY